MTGPFDGAQHKRFDALVIGGSAGSLQVIRVVLENMAPGRGIAVVVCVHTPGDGAGDAVAWLADKTRLRVCEITDGMPIVPDRVYIAPGGYHMLAEKSRYFSLSIDARVNYSRPSIDITFETMAEVYRERLLGMLVSGANEDGARGLARIHDLGGTTLVQRPDDAAAADMPSAALAIFSPSLQTTAGGLRDAVARLTCATDE